MLAIQSNHADSRGKHHKMAHSGGHDGLSLHNLWGWKAHPKLDKVSCGPCPVSRDPGPIAKCRTLHRLTGEISRSHRHLNTGACSRGADSHSESARSLPRVQGAAICGVLPYWDLVESGPRHYWRAHHRENALWHFQPKVV
jgi:hypothetical protein